MLIMHGTDGWFVKVIEPPAGATVRKLKYSDKPTLEQVGLDLREGKGVR
jgi:hypothetical protein